MTCDKTTELISMPFAMWTHWTMYYVGARFLRENGQFLEGDPLRCGPCQNLWPSVDKKNNTIKAKNHSVTVFTTQIFSSDNLNIGRLHVSYWYWRKLVAWHSGKTSVSDWRTFPVLRSTCSWWVTTNVGKPSAIGQPTRPTQPFFPFGVDKWVVSWNQMYAAIYR